MSIKEYLAGAKMSGSVQKLMTPGLAVEFIQPWYTPLSTTPSTTGIAVGGIGSTFTATPAGTAVPVVDPELAHDALHNFVLQSLLVFGRGIILNERISNIVLPFGLMPAYRAPQAFPACAGARVVFTASRACTRLSGRENTVGDLLFLLDNPVAVLNGSASFTGTALEAVVNVALLPATETGTSVPVMDSEQT